MAYVLQVKTMEYYTNIEKHLVFKNVILHVKIFMNAGKREG